jgi:cytoskeletal protein RodZ
MGQSFWSKRNGTMSTAGSYIKATDSVSRPMAAVMAVVGILVIGGLLFGVFTGARWGFAKLAGTDTKPKTTKVATNKTPKSTPSQTPSTQTEPVATPAPAVTATSSASTTTPSSTTTVNNEGKAKTAPAAVPNTGPGSNAALFMGVLAVSYLVARRKQLNR